MSSGRSDDGAAFRGTPTVRPAGALPVPRERAAPSPGPAPVIPQAIPQVTLRVLPRAIP
ncbi:hypothetical protein GCM10009549_20170 [Streptomyces thermoalcalitolerans]|uniref:Uncharacterized protein n=1 Tax=Streptomyces thermoalcalitolerans TaxID=65605 RepID=A0ABP3YY52_9ACTN